MFTHLELVTSVRDFIFDKKYELMELYMSFKRSGYLWPSCILTWTSSKLFLLLIILEGNQNDGNK